jgi:hypothetical protein
MPRAAGSILVALVAALIIPVPVLAERAERYTSSFTQFLCGDLQSDAGSAYVTAWLSDGEESFADLGFWAAPAQPGESPVTWGGWSNDTHLNADGSAIEGTFDVYGFAEGEVDDPSDLIFIGEGTLTATLTPSGDPETWRFRDQLGNHHATSSGSSQALAVSGTLSLPNDVSFDLGNCEAFRSTESWFSNSPARSVEHSTDFRLSCSWESDNGYVALFASDSEFGPTADLFVRTADGFVYSAGVATLSRSSFAATFELIPEWDDEGVPIGSASASATLTVQDRISHSEPSPEGRVTLKGVQLGVDGSMALDVEGQTTTLAMDDASCQAADVRYAQLPGRPPSVEPVPNDTPETATPLKLYDKLIVSTAGAEDAPEAPCLLDDGEGGTFEGNLTHTVWWRIEGTGGSITVDTGGSVFDTMVAVYLVEDGVVGAQVGCVDDVGENLQALITFETAADASYLVQTGGFGGETGDLALAIYEP